MNPSGKLRVDSTLLAEAVLYFDIYMQALRLRGKDYTQKP